jgi:hypothetical protein
MCDYTGRMTEHGLKQVDQAKSDGRWSRAFKSGKEMTIPEIDAGVPGEGNAGKTQCAKSFRAGFSHAQYENRSGRKKKIEALVAMLKLVGYCSAHSAANCSISTATIRALTCR